MKIRNGFVSNSSSSSFVILGVLNDNILDESMDYIHLNEGADGCVTGFILASGDEGDFFGNLPYTRIKEMVVKIQEKLGVSEDEIKIYSGVEMC